jgi:hypothetical protein
VTIFLTLLIIYLAAGTCTGIADRLHMRRFDEHGDWTTTTIIVVLWWVVLLLIIIDATRGSDRR